MLQGSETPERSEKVQGKAKELGGRPLAIKGSQGLLAPPLAFPATSETALKHLKMSFQVPRTRLTFSKHARMHSQALVIACDDIGFASLGMQPSWRALALDGILACCLSRRAQAP